MAVRLLTKEEYTPILAERGLRFVEVVSFEDGVRNLVWETKAGHRVMFPGVSGGLDEDEPMIPEYKLEQICSRLGGL